MPVKLRRARRQPPGSSTLMTTGKECWADLHPPRFRLGRLSDNNLILSQMGVSRSHAEVLIQNGEYLLRDLDSKMGTYLNGVRVEQARLMDGDRVQLGGSQGISLTFHTGDILQSLFSNSDAGMDFGLSVRGFKDIGKLFAAFRALSSIPVSGRPACIGRGYGD